MIKKLTKTILRRIGFELRRYSVQSSESARLHRLLSYFQVDVVFDVGANRGQFAESLRADGYSGRIVSFEPLKEAHEALLTASQKDEKWVVAPRMALGSTNGELVLNVSKNSVSSSAKPMLPDHISAAPDSQYIATETVSLTRLDAIADQYLDASSSPYLKIDTQGYEEEILDGAENIMSRIKGVQLELSLVPLYQGQPLMAELVKKMDSLGYQLYGMIPAFTDPGSGRLLQVDGIFFRE